MEVVCYGYCYKEKNNKTTKPSILVHGLLTFYIYSFRLVQIPFQIIMQLFNYSLAI